MGVPPATPVLLGVPGGGSVLLGGGWRGAVPGAAGCPAAPHSPTRVSTGRRQPQTRSEESLSLPWASERRFWGCDVPTRSGRWPIGVRCRRGRCGGLGGAPRGTPATRGASRRSAGGALRQRAAPTSGAERAHRGRHVGAGAIPYVVVGRPACMRARTATRHRGRCTGARVAATGARGPPRLACVVGGARVRFVACRGCAGCGGLWRGPCGCRAAPTSPPGHGGIVSAVRFCHALWGVPTPATPATPERPKDLPGLASHASGVWAAASL
jgi:hypothetical protein